MTDESGKPVRKPPRKVTAAYLQRAAMSYLERYASSAENLRRVLRRKVDKRCRLRGEDLGEKVRGSCGLSAGQIGAGKIVQTEQCIRMLGPEALLLELDHLLE